LNRTKTNGVATIPCGGVKWSSHLCPGATVPSLCTDVPRNGMRCADPCRTFNADTWGCPNLNVFSPCGVTGYGCNATAASLTGYRVLAADVAPKAPAAAVSKLVAVDTLTTQTAVTMSVTLATAAAAAGSTVLCGAFPAGGTAPASTDLIAQQNFASTADGSGTAVVTIQSLAPATSYDVYCFTQSPLGMVLGIADAVKKTLRVKTACCKTMSVKVTVDAVFQGASAANAVVVKVDTMPTTSLTVTLALAVTKNVTAAAAARARAGASATVTVTNPLLPASTTISASLPIKSFFASISSVGTATVGNAAIVATLSGDNAADYAVVYPLGNAFEVISKSSPAPSPKFLGVQFSADGTYITATFSADTNMGDIATASWKCAMLFTFPGVASAQKCQWATPSSVKITLGSTSTVAVGDSVTVVGGLVKALCTVAAGCPTWPASPASTVLVTAPLTATLPVVGVSSPAVIGPCDPYSIDFSASTGGSGRPWASATFTVSSTDTGSAATIASYLNTHVSISPPTTVPAGYFTSGSVNSVTVTLCNFLGACGRAAAQIIVTSTGAPVVSISGSSFITTTRNAGLTLNADAFVSVCGGTPGQVTRTGLDFQWKALVGGVPTTSVCVGSTCTSLQSTSKQYYTYALNPYTLLTNKQYVFSLSVLDTVKGTSTARSVTVSVVPDVVVAVVKGGGTRTVPSGGTITVDASASFDADVPGLTGPTAGLQYAWTCVQNAPTISSTCGLTMSTTSASTPSVTLTAGAGTDGQVNVITVTVFSGARSSSAQITVTTQGANVPLVTIDTQLSGAHNPQNKLALSGTATVPAGATGSATWSVNDASVVLATAALTPVASKAAAGPNTVSLVVAAGMLTPGATLTFTLTCTANGLSSASSVVVSVNAPPVPGTFAVKPAAGSELTTQFLMSASLWVDPDLPLLYAFGFVGSGNALSVVQQMSQLSYTTSLLPRGAGPVGDVANAVQCVLTVYDSFMTSATATALVSVTASSLDADALTEVLAGAGAAASPTAAVQLLSVVGTVAGVIECVFLFSFIPVAFFLV